MDPRTAKNACYSSSITVKKCFKTMPSDITTDETVTVTTQATAEIVTLQNGTSGIAFATADLTNEIVTQIVIITRTVIDKSTS
jgi:hypothetical protein